MREAEVPMKVLDRMYKGFNMPAYYEGFDEIKIIFHKNCDYIKLEKWFNVVGDISQDNPNHTMTILEHCKAVAKNFENDKGEYEGYNSKLYNVAYFHDVGKIYTKAFINGKGEKCPTAHFYNHENVGAYTLLCASKNTNIHLTTEDIVEMCTLIQWHMLLYDIKEDKISKWSNLLGEDFINKLKRLHEADVKAH